MNTIEKLGDEETFRQIVERSITSFTDDELTAISSYSFYGCTELQEVSLPLITELPQDAFYKCSKLTAFDLSNITKMDDGVFMYSGLTEANGPLVTYLSRIVFRQCLSLTKAEFPKVPYIASDLFNGCSSLVKAKFPKATSIYMQAFKDCAQLSSLIVGTELDDETAICTLEATNALPSSIGAIYVPYNLVEKYKTATNWSSFADKIQAYDVPVSCQSLTITAEDVPGYKTSAIVHYEAVCTYSIEGMMQTGTKVFKGDAVSDTFGTNPSGESSRQVEVSYTFLGQTATITITQDKYIGNPVGGKIYYIDDTADGTYSFYDADGNLMSDVSVGSTPSYYKVLTAGAKDKYYIYHDELYNSLQWGKSGTTTGATGTAIGTGKSNTATLLATDAVSSTNTIWYKLQQIRNASTGGCSDWFVPSKDEVEALRLAIGCTTSTSGAVVVGAGAVTGGTIAGTADGKTHYKYNGTYYCYPSDTKFLNTYLWSSSEDSGRYAWDWDYARQAWSIGNKNDNYSVFFARAF